MASPTLEMLRQNILRLETARLPARTEVVSSGCGPLDELLPGRGLCRGTIIEWISAGEGAGAGTLALLAAREACRGGGTLLAVNSRREFYPPAAARLGIDLERLVVVHPTTPADEHWALDQALRCPAVAVVLAWPAPLDALMFRRLQLATEEGGGLGLFVRSTAARNAPSWADVRLGVEPLPVQSGKKDRRRLRISLLRCRGGNMGRSVDVEFDDETCSVHLAARLAAAMPEGRPGAFAAGRRRRA
jgi:protein ImuA